MPLNLLRACSVFCVCFKFQAPAAIYAQVSILSVFCNAVLQAILKFPVPILAASSAYDSLCLLRSWLRMVELAIKWVA